MDIRQYSFPATISSFHQFIISSIHHFINWFHRSVDGQYCIMDHPHQYWLVKISSDGQYYIMDHPHQYWLVKISSDGQYYIVDHPHQYWQVKISSDGQYYIMDHPHQYWLVKISSDGQYYIVDHPHQMFQYRNCPTSNSSSRGGNYFIEDTVVPLIPLKTLLKTRSFHWFHRRHGRSIM